MRELVISPCNGRARMSITRAVRTDLLLRRKVLSRGSQKLRPPVRHVAHFRTYGGQMSHPPKRRTWARYH